MFEAGVAFVEEALGLGRAAGPSPARLSSAVEPAELSTAQLADRTKSWERAARALCAAQLVDVAGFDTAQRVADVAVMGVGERLVGRSVGVELALTLGISVTAANARVGFARAVVDEHPGLLGLAAEGLLSEWQLRTVVTATDQLGAAQRRLVAERVAVDVRARAVRGVKELTAYELGLVANRLVIEVDPDAATRRYERARGARAVSVTGRVNGSAALWVQGPAEQAQHMYDEVERDALTRRHDGDPRAVNDIMFTQIYETLTGFRPTCAPDPVLQPVGLEADAASAPAASPALERAGLAAGDLGIDDPAHDSYCDDCALAAPQPPRRRLVPRRRRVEVQVVLSAATLLGADEAPALLRGYGAIPAAVARAIADTGCGDDHPGRVLVRRLFCDPTDGRLVTMETSARLFTGPLRQFAILRDQTCRLSGARIRDIDHISPAYHGGPTAAGNGQALAKNSHVLRDHPSVTVRTRSQHRRPPDRTGPPDRAGPAPQLPDDLLAQLRAHAPDIEWTLPTGHTYRSEPPPALGHGSTSPPSSLIEHELTLALRRAGALN